MTRQSTEYFLVREVTTTFNFRALHRAQPERYPFLLQSTATDPTLGQYDILFAFPEGEALSLSGINRLSGPGSEAGPDFLRGLDCWWRREQCASSESPLPFHGGWFVYLGYELAAQLEPTLQLSVDPLLPTAFAVRCPAAFIHEHASARVFVVCETPGERRIHSMLADADAVAGCSTSATAPLELDTVEEPAEPYLHAVRQAKQYIAAGDIFQANLSRSWRVRSGCAISPDDVYARLCATNPAPFAGLVRWGNAAIISSSPERLIKIRKQQVSTRPIAGTRPRGCSQPSDSALSDELFGHPKERAEHVMLIDLERNDLGRVCEAGSVTVNEFMVLESYAHVHHIVSNIEGRLKKGLGPGEAIRALFPGGTITGCPKVRCMEIIAELENNPRGAYTGSFGYLNRDGSLDMNILIRTMVMQGDRLEFRAGSGIVADSDPDAELDETRAKAKGLLMALHPTGRSLFHAREIKDVTLV